MKKQILNELVDFIADSFKPKEGVQYTKNNNTVPIRYEQEILLDKRVIQLLPDFIKEDDDDLLSCLKGELFLACGENLYPVAGTIRSLAELYAGFKEENQVIEENLAVGYESQFETYVEIYNDRLLTSYVNEFIENNPHLFRN